MPETEAIPDYEMRIAENTDTGPWLRLLVIRMLRMDRTKLATRAFIRGTKQTGPRYVEAVTDTIESVFNSMVPEVPVIFLLSVGADPTNTPNPHPTCARTICGVGIRHQNRTA